MLSSSIAAHSTLGVFATARGVRRTATSPSTSSPSSSSSSSGASWLSVSSRHAHRRHLATVAAPGGSSSRVAHGLSAAAVTPPLYYMSGDGKMEQYRPGMDVTPVAKKPEVPEPPPVARSVLEAAAAAKLIAKPGAVSIPHAVSADTIAALSDAAVGAANMPFSVLMWRSVAAGVFVGLGGILCASLGGDVPGMAMANPGAARFLFGAIGFPVSIFLVTTLGGLAFTGSLVAVGCAWLAPLQFTHGATKSRQVLSIEEGLRVLGTMFVGNCVGLLGMATMAVAGGMECVGPCAEIALHKAMETGGEAFWRAVGGGILITMAVTQSFAAKSGTEKFMGIWLCISTYVACGWEHGLANLLFFPIALMSGGAAPLGITTGSFIFGNLIPVTIGNMVGGFSLAVALIGVHAATAPAPAAGAGAAAGAGGSPGLSLPALTLPNISVPGNLGNLVGTLGLAAALGASIYGPGQPATPGYPAAAASATMAQRTAAPA
eukprot:CAMPEP_0197590710 /NCGR_PEP_ID=MMETSP1326-20131121/12084_1 /TAXON_ID=1155430 /ORGANISM="Genus nov. species nov., Strain RCC2288" /LENGTH=489 /DNA_ID=CAMNT_0043155949 /DNA_START=193 /DNA_END=1658 /DNA_ORIENTATION=-